MSKTETRKINRFTVRIYPEGNVLIAEPRLNFAWCFLFLAGSLVTGVFSLFTGTKYEFYLSLICVISLIAAGILFRAWLKPGSIYISNGHQHFRVKTSTEKFILEMTEIDRIYVSAEHEVYAIRADTNERKEIELLRFNSGSESDANQLLQLISNHLVKSSENSAD